MVPFTSAERSVTPYVIDAFQQDESVPRRCAVPSRLPRHLAPLPLVEGRKKYVPLEVTMHAGQMDPARARQCVTIDRRAADDHHLAHGAGERERGREGRRDLAARRGIVRLGSDDDIPAARQSAPDGFVLAFGSPVAPGRPARASLVDITPTVLYFLGLPVGAAGPDAK